MRAALALVVLAGCHPADLVSQPLPGHAGAPEVPRLLGPSDVAIRGALAPGSVVEDAFSAREGTAVGYVLTLAAPSAVVVELDADAPAELFAYGPLRDEGWFAAPVVGRDAGGGSLRLVTHDPGAYLVAAFGPPGSAAPFVLWVRPDDE